MKGAFACEEHFSQVVKDVRRESDSITWSCSERDELQVCEYPGCDNGAFFEVIGFEEEMSYDVGEVKLINGEEEDLPVVDEEEMEKCWDQIMEYRKKMRVTCYNCSNLVRCPLMEGLDLKYGVFRFLGFDIDKDVEELLVFFARRCDRFKPTWEEFE